MIHIKSIDGQEVEQLLSLLRSLHPYLVQRKSNVTKSIVGGGPSTQSTVNSLLPQYMAVYRLSFPSHLHSLSSVVSSVSSAASSASKGIKGSTSSESHTYLLLLRNPLSSEQLTSRPRVKVRKIMTLSSFSKRKTPTNCCPT